MNQLRCRPANSLTSDIIKHERIQNAADRRRLSCRVLVHRQTIERQCVAQANRIQRCQSSSVCWLHDAMSHDSNLEFRCWQFGHRSSSLCCHQDTVARLACSRMECHARRQSVPFRSTQPLLEQSRTGQSFVLDRAARQPRRPVQSIAQIRPADTPSPPTSPAAGNAWSHWSCGTRRHR